MSNRTRKFRVGGLGINLVEGDLAQVKADALITAINSEGDWRGGIDGVIQRAAGNMFHAQAMAALPLTHTQTMVAKKPRGGQHRGQFGDVVFVIDDLEGPLSAVIIAALTAADSAHYRTVSLPAIRTGVMLGRVEKDASAAAREIVTGIEAFMAARPNYLEEMTIVVYNATEIFDALAYDLERVRR
jgi:O-acetyl-ADP-ribose deacetylase (regulator of RNase III)